MFISSITPDSSSILEVVLTGYKQKVIMSIILGALAIGGGVHQCLQKKGKKRLLGAVLILGGACLIAWAVHKYQINQSVPEFLIQRDKWACKSAFSQGSRYSYQVKPGFYNGSNPVQGSRAEELRQIKTLFQSEPLLGKLEDGTYYNYEFDSLIPLECEGIAHQRGREMFSNYIEKYRKYGLNECNAINWWLSDDGSFNEVKHLPEGGLVAFVQRSMFGLYRYSPNGLTALHELMHVEEDGTTFAHAGAEILTRMTDIINEDQIVKECKNKHLSSVYDHGVNLVIDGLAIPSGKVANCYRQLTAKFGHLYKAILSPESFHFLRTGIC